ncbi:MAG: hypothetical protein LBE83_09570, partial [Propionibacteriaceae bacterium]|jgi:hypothetical protein|nr:hypothetical protein [Propionibacteriaceae bacterium]
VVASWRKAKSDLGFWRDLSLLGAALVAAQDTQGKPSLVWLARQRRHAKLATIVDAKPAPKRRVSKSDLPEIL